MSTREKVEAILQKAKTMAEGEIAEKIELALKAMTGGENWSDIFTAGYYASWAEGLANQLQEGTPLCNLLNEMIDLLTYKPKRRVVIVEEGHWGDLEEGEYKTWIGLVQRALEGRDVEVYLAGTFDAAQTILKREVVSALVFVSRGMLSAAKIAVGSYPKVRVVVLSGWIPGSDEQLPKRLVFVDKGKLRSSSLICKAVLGT